LLVFQANPSAGRGIGFLEIKGPQGWILPKTKGGDVSWWKSNARNVAMAAYHGSRIKGSAYSGRDEISDDLAYRLKARISRRFQCIIINRNGLNIVS
jgi:hypothetical protein